MADRIEHFISLLDDDSTEVAEDAKAELITIGRAVVGPLAAAVGSLQRFGQLSAIEAFDQLGDPAAGPALVALLGSDDPTVRQWSAQAIRAVGFRDAVPALRDAYRRCPDRPDSLEAVAIRDTLTDLGGRQEVVPRLTASLRGPDGWPSDRLADVVNDLADHDQAVLDFRLWGVIDGVRYLNGHEYLDELLDFGRPWPEIVERAREAALIEAAFVVPRPNLFAHVEWIDRTDL